MEHQQEGKMLVQPWFSTLTFIKWLFLHVGVMTTAWIKCGGMSFGWDTQ
jgi:hypothetical protein